MPVKDLERTTDDAVRILNLEKNFSCGRGGLLLGITRQRMEQIAQRLRKSSARRAR